MTPLCRRLYREYPNFVNAFANRHTMYNETIEYIRRREKEGQAFVIRPKAKLDVASAEKNPVKLKAVYELGRQAAEEAMKKGMQEWLKK